MTWNSKYLVLTAALLLPGWVVAAVDTAGFEKNVKPILKNTCSGCHNASVMSGGVNLVPYMDASTVAEDRDVITVENTISFLRPAASAELFCRATVLREGQNLVFVEAEVMVEGDAGRVLVAKMSSTLAVIALKAKPAEKPASSS